MQDLFLQCEHKERKKNRIKTQTGRGGAKQKKGRGEKLLFLLVDVKIQRNPFEEVFVFKTIKGPK